MAEPESVSPLRSRNMAAIREKDTAPEVVVRRMLHGMGLRFRLQRKDLPGRPDIVLLKQRVAVFVHECFWHRYEGCPFTITPKTRQEFWLAKFARKWLGTSKIRLNSSEWAGGCWWCGSVRCGNLRHSDVGSRKPSSHSAERLDKVGMFSSSDSFIWRKV